MPLGSVKPADVPEVQTLAMEEKDQTEEVSQSWGKVFATGFERENILSSFIQWNKGHPGRLTEGEKAAWLEGRYDPMEETKGTKYEQEWYLDSIARARSPRELEWVKSNIDRLEENERIMAEAGTGKAITAGITGAVFDPILAPTLAIPAVRGSLMAKTTGTGITAGVLAGGSEVGLHATQPTRTKTESAINIGASTLLGSLLGTFGPRVSSEEAAKMKAAVEAEVEGRPIFPADTTFRSVDEPVAQGPDYSAMGWNELRAYAKEQGVSAGGTRADIEARLDALDPISRSGPTGAPGAGARVTPGGGTGVPLRDAGTGPEAGAAVGAARTEGGTAPPGFRADLERQVEEGILSEREAAKMLRDKELEYTALRNEPLMRAFKFGSPVLRVALSKSPKARDILENLVEDSFIRQKNMFGHTADFAVETRAKAQSHVKEANLYDILGESYRNYVGATSAIGRVSKRMRDPNIMSREDFSNEVGKAMARGDQHNVPEVAAAAKSIRKNISEPLERELVREKLIPTDPEGNPIVQSGDLSYFPRVYDWGKIAGDRAGFKAHIMGRIREKILKSNEGRPDTEAVKAFDDPQFRRELNARLDQTIEKIIGSPHGYYPHNLVPGTGFLKKRKLNLSFDDLEPYLIKDAIQVQRSYLQNVVPQLEIKKRFSGIELEDELEAVNKEYIKTMEDLPPNSRQMRKMEQERKQVMNDISAMRDIMLHRYERPRNPSSVWNQAGHAMRALNFMRALGGVTVSSIPDVGQTIARMGLRPFSKSFFKLAASPRAMGISRAEAKRMGAGLDAILHTRANLLMMASEDSVSPVNKFTRTLDAGVRGFSKASGMSYWNSGLKQFAAIMYADEIGRMAASGKALSRGQRARLAAAHIGEDDWNLIIRNFQEHGTKENGIWIPNIDEWDEGVKDTFAGALLKEVDTSVVTPGVGDLPLIARTPVGKVIAQFKSFILTAHNRIFLGGMQRAMLDAPGAANQAAGFMTMMGLGTMAYSLKQYAKGDEPELENFNVLARQALDHSGYVGYMMELNNWTEKTTRGTVGLSSVFGHMGLGEAEPITRYHARSVLEDILGPSAGTAEDALQVLGAVTNKSLGEEINESDIRAVRRLLPYQNLIYIRRALNEVEEGAVERWAE